MFWSSITWRGLAKASSVDALVNPSRDACRKKLRVLINNLLGGFSFSRHVCLQIPFSHSWPNPDAPSIFRIQSEL
jgi:hypothetical protein